MKTTSTAPSAASSPASAEAYCNWLIQCIDGVEAEMPAITKSAEAAAKKYVEESYGIAAYGDEGFVREPFNRSGGIMQLQPASKLVYMRDSEVMNITSGKLIVLVGLRENHWAEDVATIRDFRHRGDKMLVAFGTQQQFARAHAEGAWFNVEIINYAVAENGLFTNALTGPLIATQNAASNTAMWTWTAEFVAACTRMGKMPPMYLGYAMGKAAIEREKKYKGLKFHAEKPLPVEPGVLGHQYLASLRGSVTQIKACELGKIRQAAEQAIAARSAGGKLYTYMQGHSTLYLHPAPHDPGYFQTFSQTWGTRRRDVDLKPGDFVLCVGFAQLYRGEDYEFFTDYARSHKASLVWTIAAFDKNEVNGVGKDELLIDQHWERGDAVVTVPGYDIKILPVSGIIAESMYWMVSADMLGILQSSCQPLPPAGTGIAAR